MSAAYPEGEDLVWPAVDGGGQVALLITGGDGPIPAAFLANRGSFARTVESVVADMPVVSSASACEAEYDDEDFTSLAQRGFFVYDWIGFYRAVSSDGVGYRRVAVPSSPLNIRALTEPLASMAQLTRASGYFDALPLWDVRVQIECLFGHG